MYQDQKQRQNPVQKIRIFINLACALLVLPYNVSRDSVLGVYKLQKHKYTKVIELSKGEN